MPKSIKIVKTCPVCFRHIAVKNGIMVHHGYKRPTTGVQTASCEGTRFKPLEVSSEGLEWLISSLRKRLVEIEHALDNQAIYPESLDYVHRGHIKRITRNDPMWPKHFAGYTGKLKAEMYGIERELPVLDKKLANWVPENN